MPLRANRNSHTRWTNLRGSCHTSSRTPGQYLVQMSSQSLSSPPTPDAAHSVSRGVKTTPHAMMRSGTGVGGRRVALQLRLECNVAQLAHSDDPDADSD